ncbi:hypothetical protein ACSQ5K_26480 [Pseudomonas sp. PhalM4]
MALKVLIHSIFYGFLFLVAHWFSHAWPVAAQHQEVKDLFAGPLIIVFYTLNALAFPLNYLLGWTWEAFNELNLFGPFIAGFALTAYRMRKQSESGEHHAS